MINGLTSVFLFSLNDDDDDDYDLKADYAFETEFLKIKKNKHWDMKYGSYLYLKVYQSQENAVNFKYFV